MQIITDKNDYDLNITPALLPLDQMTREKLLSKGHVG